MSKTRKETLSGNFESIIHSLRFDAVKALRDMEEFTRDVGGYGLYKNRSSGKTDSQ